jgi:hypothetical protein
MKRVLFLILLFCSVANAQQRTISGMPLMKSTLIDLNNVWTVKDDNTNHTGVLISATADPGGTNNGTYTYTVLSNNIPSNTNVTDYQVFMTINGFNNDVSSRTLNWAFCLNGVEINGTNSITVTNGKFWAVMGRFQAAKINATDIIGVRLWASVTNTLDYRDVTMYIVPRTLNVPAVNCIATQSPGGTNNTGTITGAISGTTYNNPFNTSITFASGYDPGTSTAGSVSTTATILGAPQYFQVASSLTDNNNNNSSGTFNAQTLYLMTSMTRYLRQWQF